MNIEKVDIKTLVMNPNNPRTIRDDKFKKLVKSIKEFPEMLDVRPIVVDEDMVVLGGNMRLKACLSAGLKEVSIIKFNDLDENRKKEFVLKDNQSFGEWDNNLLSNWDKDMLLNSGFEEWEMLDIFGVNDLDNKYKGNIEGSNFNPEEVDVNDYIKQNILFFNEFMIEFEDDSIKECIRNLKSISSQEAFVNDLKKLITQYGKNSI
jgi:FKBP-type peptidyl-prolyl cis-trans isomerase 2